ncbi:MAG: hypothetical protein ABI740_09875 [Alphaproteobacteria bacterium]
MRGRGLAFAIVLALVAIPAAWADPRIFERQDYESYFAPGRFETRAPFYSSVGLFEILGNSVRAVGGRYVLEQTTHALDVSANYDVRSIFGYYKIESHAVQDMIWDERRHIYAYTYSDREFDTNDSIVWESSNDRIEISKDDVKRGILHHFYNDADGRTGQNVEALDAQYRKDVVGAWMMQCAYIRDSKYDVDCTVTHIPTRRVEHYFYRKLDLVG